ncbi:hypothetical protein JG688_00016111 [Phytophthora aleatoria]|uniref:Peptidase S1 domain-containing protein n=1 Tax=Phytophthora aleatoria TaxID=2496075 RepID=A0A8J5I4M2_9STRA|nr:hypothetical protein JG688_00016111 [Phytophthora aleatoria]
MKLLHGIAFVSAMATLAAGFSFSEITAAQSAPSNGRNDVTDVTSDEESRMFGGSNADNKKHPYVAELLAKSITDERFCGGTLIAPQYVLTAAEQIRVVETYRHPVFNSTWLPYDVALLKLEKPSTHKPARLCDADGSDNKPGTMASVFGNTDFTFCTTGKGFCDGDTGGPLIANGVVVGTCIASMLPGDAGDCGDRHSLYARVSHVLDYISDIVNGGSTGNDTDSIMQKTQ